MDKDNSNATWSILMTKLLYLNKSWWCLHRRQNIYSV